MVIKVSDSSLAQDCGRKLEIHSTAGIPVYWIVNLIDDQIEVYTAPRPGVCGSRVVYKAGERVSVIIDGRRVGEIAVEDILPSRRITEAAREA